jgi:hypothetical protein
LEKVDLPGRAFFLRYYIGLLAAIKEDLTYLFSLKEGLRLGTLLFTFFIAGNTESVGKGIVEESAGDSCFLETGIGFY